MVSCVFLVLARPLAGAGLFDFSVPELLDEARETIDENLNGDTLALPDPDPDQMDQFFRDFYTQLEGEYVVDLLPFKQTADFLAPLLEAHESLRDLGAWLRTRRDYFDVSEELRVIVPPWPPRLGTNAPGGSNLPPDRGAQVVPGVSTSAPPARAAGVTNPTVSVEVVPKNPPADASTPAVVRTNPEASLVARVWERQYAMRAVPLGAAGLLPQLRLAFQAAGLPAELAWLAEVESGFDPRARSPVGAVGLYQLMPATAREMGLKTFPLDERKQPEKSAAAAAQYLRQLHGDFGDWPLTLAAYNAGPGRVRRTLASRGARTFAEISRWLPAETQLYVPKFAAVLARREGLRLSDLPGPQRLLPVASPIGK